MKQRTFSLKRGLLSDLQVSEAKAELALQKILGGRLMGQQSFRLWCWRLLLVSCFLRTVNACVYKRSISVTVAKQENSNGSFWNTMTNIQILWFSLEDLSCVYRVECVSRSLTRGVGDWSMKAAEVDETVGAQEEVGNQGCDYVQLTYNDTGGRNQKHITNPDIYKGNNKLMKRPLTVFIFT